MVIDENWGVSIVRIRQFFFQQPDVSEAAGEFRYRSCCITLTELPGHPVGPWSVPRTRVQMSGSEEDVTAIYHRFFMRFLSAGG